MASGGGAALTLVTERVDVEAVETGLQTGNSAGHDCLTVGVLGKVDDTLDVVLLFRVPEDTLGVNGLLGNRVVRLRSMEVLLMLIVVWEAITCGGMRWLGGGVGGGGMGRRLFVTLLGWAMVGLSVWLLSTMGRAVAARRAILLGFCRGLSIGGERTSGKEGKNGGKPLHVDLLYDLYDL